VSVKKHRFVRKAFFHLRAEGIQMFANASSRCEIMAENLRHPLEVRLFQNTEKVRAIRDLTQ